MGLFIIFLSVTYGIIHNLLISNTLDYSYGFLDYDTDQYLLPLFSLIYKEFIDSKLPIDRIFLLTIKLYLI